jgi:hypothetical protein
MLLLCLNEYATTSSRRRVCWTWDKHSTRRDDRGVLSWPKVVGAHRWRATRDVCLSERRTKRQRNEIEKTTNEINRVERENWTKEIASTINARVGLLHPRPVRVGLTPLCTRCCYRLSVCYLTRINDSGNDSNLPRHHSLSANVPCTCRTCVRHDGVHLSTRESVDPLSSPAVGQCMKADTSRHLRVRLAAHLPLRDVMARPANGIRCSTSVVNSEARVMHCGDFGGVVTYTQCTDPVRLWSDSAHSRPTSVNDTSQVRHAPTPATRSRGTTPGALPTRRTCPWMLCRPSV